MEASEKDLIEKEIIDNLLEEYLSRVIAETTSAVITEFNIPERLKQIEQSVNNRIDEISLLVNKLLDSYKLLAEDYSIKIQLLDNQLRSLMERFNNDNTSIESIATEMQEIMRYVEELSDEIKKIEEEINLETGLLSVVSEDSKQQISMIAELINGKNAESQALSQMLQEILKNVTAKQKATEQQLLYLWFFLVQLFCTTVIYDFN